ncbi:MAG: GGDEF domain-containing protein [Tepidimonas ignava]
MGELDLRALVLLLGAIGVLTSVVLQHVWRQNRALLGKGIGFVLLSQQRLQQHMRELASHDSLTGAMTRAAWWNAALHEVLRQRRQGAPLTPLMLDLDHFKRINDTHGRDRVVCAPADAPAPPAVAPTSGTAATA